MQVQAVEANVRFRPNKPFNTDRPFIYVEVVPGKGKRLMKLQVDNTVVWEASNSTVVSSASLGRGKALSVHQTRFAKRIIKTLLAYTIVILELNVLKQVSSLRSSTQAVTQVSCIASERLLTY